MTARQRHPEPTDTQDRIRVSRWRGDQTLEQAAQALGRSKSWLSEWFSHKKQVRDEEIDLWVEVTGVSRTVFFEGRYKSRMRAKNGRAA